MAYSEVDRAYIRHFVGYGAIFLQAEPRLENAIIATQSVSDGGARPDSSTENYIKGIIYGVQAVTTGTTGVVPNGVAQNVVFNTPAVRGLLQIEANIANLDPLLGVLEAYQDAKLDTAREMLRLRMEGRRLAHGLSKMLGMKGVRADVFSAAPRVIDDDPFSYSDMHKWRGGP